MGRKNKKVYWRQWRQQPLSAKAKEIKRTITLPYLDSVGEICTESEWHTTLQSDAVLEAAIFLSKAFDGTVM